MASMDSVQQKLNRVETLYKELKRELIAYYKTNPGEMFEITDSPPDNRTYYFREKESIPPHLALIAGDALQCLRSSLDYLVWELVEANGNEPHERLMFPICTTEESYKKAIKGGRLRGVSQESTALIKALQPFNHAEPENTVLAMLDSLTNINKHRRVILTTFAGSTSEIPAGIPHIFGEATLHLPDGELAGTIPIRAVLTIQDGFAKHIEITNFIDVTAHLLTEEVLPLFKRFFERVRHTPVHSGTESPGLETRVGGEIKTGEVRG